MEKKKKRNALRSFGGDLHFFFFKYGGNEFANNYNYLHPFKME